VSASSRGPRAGDRRGTDSLAARIEHTLLRPDATAEEVYAHCEAALVHGFLGVTIAGSWVPLALGVLAQSPVKVVSVAGFPLGASSTLAKAAEAREAVCWGAHEVDVVIHLGHARAADHYAVEADVRGVVEAAEGRPVKAILETAFFSLAEAQALARAAVQGGAALVKTSTGFGPGGATVEVVRALREAVGAGVGIKASGGIRTREAAEALLAAGADRIGTSASLAIMARA
jgi:deoxyribose-phosphate aldolase